MISELSKFFMDFAKKARAGAGKNTNAGRGGFSIAKPSGGQGKGGGVLGGLQALFDGGKDGSGISVDSVQGMEAVTPREKMSFPVTPQLAQAEGGTISPINQTRNEIARRQGKDFSKKKNEDGTYTYGKDYDDDHNWKDALRSFGIGALQGLANSDPNASIGSMIGSALGGGAAGGIAGAVDRNADEKMGNKIALNNLYKDYAPQVELEQAELKAQREARKADTDEAYRQAQIQDIDTNNKLAAEKELNRTRYYDGLIADKKKGRELQVEQIDDLRKYREFLIQNGTRNTDAKIKQIDERLKDYDDDRASRERIAGMREQGQNRRQQITIEAQRQRDEYNKLVAAGKMEAAAKIKIALEQLKKEYELLGQQ